MISVQLVAVDRYQVEVTQPQNRDFHVQMSQAYYRSLCGATMTHEFVLMQALQLLLAQDIELTAEFDLESLLSSHPNVERDLRQRVSP